jgi:hypothetical protein
MTEQECNTLNNDGPIIRIHKGITTRPPKRLFTIRMNHRVYETLCAQSAWLFAGIFDVDSMKSTPHNGKEFEGLIQVR